MVISFNLQMQFKTEIQKKIELVLEHSTLSLHSLTHAHTHTQNWPECVLVGRKINCPDFSLLQASKYLQKRERGERVNSDHTLTKYLTVIQSGYINCWCTLCNFNPWGRLPCSAHGNTAGRHRPPEEGLRSTLSACTVYRTLDKSRAPKNNWVGQNHSSTQQH